MADRGAIYDLFYQEKARQAAVVEKEQDFPDPFNVTAPLGPMQTISAGIEAGGMQQAGDIERFGAIFNILVGDEEGAEKRLNQAEFYDKQSALITDRIPTSWEDVVNDPSSENILEQAAFNLGRVTPMMASSIAGGAGGFVGGFFARMGLRAAGVAASREMAEEVVKKAAAGATLDATEKAIYTSAIRMAKLPTRSAIAGAFGQSYVVSSAQSLQEFKEADPGVELTKDEAGMALLIGVPIAALDTLGEVFFAKSFIKGALKRTPLGQTLNKARKGEKLTTEQQKLLRLYEKRASGAKLAEGEMTLLRKSSGAGTYIGQFVNDLARSTGRNLAVEGLTEGAQESINIAQRFAIDDEYTQSMANLRLGEAIFAGAVAGGARGAAGSSISNIFSGAKDMIEQGYERKYRQEARRQQYGDGREVIPETQEQLDAQAEAVMDGGIDKDAIWVPNTPEGGKGLVPNYPEGVKVYAAITPSGILYTTNAEKFKSFDQSHTSRAPTLEALRQALGYSAVKNETHDRVVQIIKTNSDGTKSVVSEESTNAEGVRVAVRFANRRIKNKDVYSSRVQMLDETVRERNMDIGVETSEMLDAEATEAGTLGVANVEADMTATEGVTVKDADAGAFDYFRDEDGEVQLYQATGKASEANKQKFLDDLTTEEQQYWIARNQDGTRKVDQLSDSVINRYFKQAEDPNVGEVFISEYSAGMFAVGLGSTAEFTLSAMEILQQAKNKAKQTGFKTKKTNRLEGWQLREEDGTTSDINIQDLVIAGRTLSEQEASNASFGQQLARGFPALIDQLAQEGSVLLYKGVPVNAEILSNAPVFFQKGREFTLSQLERLPRMPVMPETTADIQSALENELGLSEENLIEEAKSRYPELANLTDEDIKADPRYFDALENIAFEEGVDTAAVKSGVVDRGVESVPEVTTLDPNTGQTTRTGLGEQDAMMGQPLEATGPSVEKVMPTRLDLEEGEGWYDTSRTLEDPTYAERAKGPQQINKGVSYSSDAAAIFSEYDSDGNLKQGGDNLLSKLKNVIDKNFKVNRKIKIITADDKATFTFNKGATYLDEQGNRIDPNSFIRAKQEQMKRTGRQGKIVTFGDTDLIILNVPTTRGKRGSVVVKPDDLYTAVLAVGHELGHSLFIQEINKLVDSPNLWKVLNKEFEKAQDQVGAPYTGDFGFEEWYADQMALFLLNEGKKPGNGSEAYFKRLANKIRKFFGDLHRTIQQRFGKGVNPEFENYAQQVVQSYKDGRTFEEQPLETITRVRIRNMVGQLGNIAEKTIGKKNARKLTTEAKRILSGVEEAVPGSMRHWTHKWLLAPADNYMRGLHPAAEEIANIFYSRSQSRDKTGHLNYRILVINRYLNTLYDLVDADKPGNPTRAEVASFTQYLYEAEQQNVNTEDLSPKAKEVRKWLDNFFETYVAPNNPNIKKRTNFFSRQLALSSIENSPQIRGELFNVLRFYVDPTTGKQVNAGVSDTLLNNIIEDIIRQEEATDDNVDESGSDLAIGMGVERAKVFRDIPNEALRRGVDEQGNINPEGDVGVLISPDQAIRKYVEDMIKRTDYNDKARATITVKDLNKLKNIKGFEDVEAGTEVTGWRAVETLLQRIDDPIKQQGARDTVKGMLGKTGLGMKPWMRNINSWAMFGNVVTYLTFAVLASLPDLAGPMLRSKEFAGLGVGVKQLQHYFSNKEEMQQFARDVGVTTFDSIATMYVNASEMNFMTDTAKKFTDGFFRVTFTEMYTKFTRTFALGMGEQFLLTHANRAKNGDVTSIRYLDELNVNADAVLKWAEKERKTGQKGTRRSFETAEGKQVRDALGRFVDESIIRPNAAERPAWASNPYTALIWQLKSFFYAYGKNIIGGAMREMENKYAETGELSMSAIPLAMGAMTLLPLTMVGLELRELIKFLFSGLDPFQGGGFGQFNERKLASNRMDYGEYSMEILDRSGVLGPYGLILPMWEAGNYGDEFWVSPLGPTAERLEDLVKGDIRFKKYVPFYASF